jgi:hypothetical protein
MEMNSRELLTVIHGMVFGFIFLLGFSGALYMIYSMKPELLTVDGIKKTANGAKTYMWVLALSVWGALGEETDQKYDPGSWLASQLII